MVGRLESFAGRKQYNLEQTTVALYKCGLIFPKGETELSELSICATAWVRGE